MKYSLIYADPPWPFANRLGNKNKQVALTSIYKTMSLADLTALDVESIAAKNCLLAMWTTDTHLQYALAVMRAWGFTYKTVLFWWHKKHASGKTATNMGRYTVKCGELCLLGTRGQPMQLVKNRRQRQLIEALRRKHSQKPKEAILRLEAMAPDTKKIELFARKRRPNWDAFGNEITGGVKIPMNEKKRLTDWSAFNRCGVENKVRP